MVRKVHQSQSVVNGFRIRRRPELGRLAYARSFEEPCSRFEQLPELGRGSSSAPSSCGLLRDSYSSRGVLSSGGEGLPLWRAGSGYGFGVGGHKEHPDEENDSDDEDESGHFENRFELDSAIPGPAYEDGWTSRSEGFKGGSSGTWSGKGRDR